MTEFRFRSISAVFLIAVLVHGVDHLRRGQDVVTTAVRAAGSTQLVLAAIAVALVFRRHRLAPVAAIALGLPSAIGFAAAHLLPHWSSFSDSFVGTQRGAGVNAFSWFTAVFEIAADLVFAGAGLAVLRQRGIASAARPRVA